MTKLDNTRHYEWGNVGKGNLSTGNEEIKNEKQDRTRHYKCRHAMFTMPTFTEKVTKIPTDSTKVGGVTSSTPLLRHTLEYNVQTMYYSLGCNKTHHTII